MPSLLVGGREPGGAVKYHFQLRGGVVGRAPAAQLVLLQTPLEPHVLLQINLSGKMHSDC